MWKQYKEYKTGRLERASYSWQWVRRNLWLLQHGSMGFQEFLFQVCQTSEYFGLCLLTAEATYMFASKLVRGRNGAGMAWCLESFHSTGYSPLQHQWHLLRGANPIGPNSGPSCGLSASSRLRCGTHGRGQLIYWDKQKGRHYYVTFPFSFKPLGTQLNLPLMRRQLLLKVQQFSRLKDPPSECSHLGDLPPCFNNPSNHQHKQGFADWLLETFVFAKTVFLQT